MYYFCKIFERGLVVEFVLNSSCVSKTAEETSPKIWSNYSTTTLNMLVNLECSHNFFQINNPKYADMMETGIKIGTMNFHKSCSKINTLSKVIRSIPKNDLNIFTDHGKYIVTKKNEMAIENMVRLRSSSFAEIFLFFCINIEITSNVIGTSMLRR